MAKRSIELTTQQDDRHFKFTSTTWVEHNDGDQIRIGSTSFARYYGGKDYADEMVDHGQNIGIDLANYYVAIRRALVEARYVTLEHHTAMIKERDHVAKLLGFSD